VEKDVVLAVALAAELRAVFGPLSLLEALVHVISAWRQISHLRPSWASNFFLRSFGCAFFAFGHVAMWWSKSSLPQKMPRGRGVSSYLGLTSTVGFPASDGALTLMTVVLR